MTFQREKGNFIHEESVEVTNLKRMRIKPKQHTIHGPNNKQQSGQC